MKTITLKTDDSFFEKVSQLSKQLHLTKSEFIRRAITEFEQNIKRHELKMQIIKASEEVRCNSLEITQDFSSTFDDGLQNA